MARRFRGLAHPPLRCHLYVWPPYIARVGVCIRTVIVIADLHEQPGVRVDAGFSKLVARVIRRPAREARAVWNDFSPTAPFELGGRWRAYSP